MKKSEIETYMDAYMEGFWKCYDIMIDLIDDDLSEITQEALKGNTEEPKPKPKPEQTKPKPKTEPKQTKKDTPTHGQFVELYKQGKLPTEIAKELGVSPATAYNHLNKAKQEGEL